MSALENIRLQFPALANTELVYLDTAAMAQECQTSIQCMQRMHTILRSNVHRGIHDGIDATTNAYEHARTQVQTFIGATESSSIIFTKNCTESINTVIFAHAAHHITDADTVILSLVEHHSAIVPWLLLQKKIPFTIQWVPLTSDYTVDYSQLEHIFQTHSVRYIVATGLSNVLGTLIDYEAICTMARTYKAYSILDAAQLIAHVPLDVRKIQCDFLVCSGYKMYGPTGIGILYCSPEVQQSMKPFMGGGMMVESVQLESFTPAQLPHILEAGTPPIAAAICLGATAEWLQSLPRNDIALYESELLQTLQVALMEMPTIHVLHSSMAPVGNISFYSSELHAHDIADILNNKGIHVRAGQHCCMPLHTALGIPASVRVSVGMYTTMHDIHACIDCLRTITTKLVS